MNSANALEKYLQDVSEAVEAELVEETPGQWRESKSRGSGRTHAERLLRLAEDILLFTEDGSEVAYGVVCRAEHREVWPIRSRGFRRWLLSEYYRCFEAPPNAQALTDALAVLEARAQFGGRREPVYVRTAFDATNDRIYVDLVDDDWRVVEVSAGGWRVLSTPPIYFRRAHGMLPLPVPEEDGSVDRLRCFVNLAERNDFTLFVGWILAALRAAGPFPILILHGEQGSAKSTLTRIARELLDPNTAPLRSSPREARDAMIAANNGAVLAFDNISHLPGWLSDIFCRLSTGGGFSTRELYSDADEVLFAARRPVLLNGIEEIASRADLLDRAILLTLPRIDDTQRQPEQIFWAKFYEARPNILGGLFSAVATGLRHCDSVALASYPRMADAVRWVTACEPALSSASGDFAHAYAVNRGLAYETTLDAAAVSAPLREFVRERQAWAGTASELLALLDERAEDNLRRNRRAWPQSARGLAGALRRVAPALRAVGVSVEFSRESGSGRRLVHLERKESASTVTTVTRVMATEKPNDFTSEAVTVCDESTGSVTQTAGGPSQEKPSKIEHCDGHDGRDAEPSPLSDDFEEIPL